MSANPQAPVIEVPHFTRNDEREATAVQAWQANPMHMLAVAVQRGMDVATIKDLMDLQQRFEKAEAEKSYNAAFADFKAEAVQVIKNKLVTDGPLKGKAYAELFAVVDAATPALSKHGLAATWKVTKDEKDWIEVTCILKHVQGHSESVSFGGPPDTGGAKNAIQARASTVTYLERYTFKAVTGLAEKTDDSDGNTSSGVLAPDEIAKWVKAIEATTTKAKAKEVCIEAIAAAEALNDLTAYQTFKDAHKKHSEFMVQAGA